MLVKTFTIVDANDQSIIDCTDVFFWIQQHKEPREVHMFVDLLLHEVCNKSFYMFLRWR